MSSRVAGESHANQVAELIGFKDNYLLGEGYDYDSNGNDDVVALRPQGTERASRERSSRSRKNKKWKV